MRLHHSFPALLAILFGGCATGKPKLVPVSHVELPRYMGTWRVIAVTDNKAEKNFTDATETYALREGKKIGVTFKWRDKKLTAPQQTHEFDGRVADTQTNALWKMKLFPLFSASYVIIAVDKDYQWAAVAHPSRKFGWILARDEKISDVLYDKLMVEFEKQGYTKDQFRLVPQP